MTTLHFSFTEHILPCQYIREYPGAVKTDDAPLKLAIKEYRPLDSVNIATDAVTIIATHGNGFPKEVYEPLFDDMWECMGGKIRSIWFADCSHQGASGVLNRCIQGDDRTVYLSLCHPRLFHSLALIEPVIQPDEPFGSNAALPSSLRRDVWPSRSVAELSFRRNRVFKNWDPRALERYVRYGLHEIPSSSNPTLITEAPHPVTLTTSKTQEVWTYMRSNFVPVPDSRQARLVAPDVATESAAQLFYRPEMILTFRNLPSVRPNVLWLFGAKSHINSSEASRVDKVERTGTDVGGSGGTTSGSVESVVLAEAGHFLPFESVRECASELAPWIERQIQDFKTAEEFLRSHNSGKSEHEQLSKLWLENVRLGSHARRNDKSRL
ncbi:MAG: hypothetical protein Q9191_001796 [Dirinaria sp. TL-2023a]